MVKCQLFANDNETQITNVKDDCDTIGLQMNIKKTKVFVLKE